MQKGLQFTHAANKAAQGVRIVGHHGGSLKTEGDVMGGGVEETRSTYGTGSGHTGTPAKAKKVPAFNQKPGNRRPPAKRHAYQPWRAHAGIGPTVRGS